MNQEQSNLQYDEVIVACRGEFLSKSAEYGQSWHRYRASSLLEKVCIKLDRIRKIQQAREQKVEDPIEKEFPAIINYCIMGRIKCHGWKENLASDKEFSHSELRNNYDEQAAKIKQIFEKKNYDYNESWRQRSIGFMVDEMLVKYDRGAYIIKSSTIKTDDKPGKLEEIFTDICNYAVFCTIRIKEKTDPMI